MNFVEHEYITQHQAEQGSWYAGGKDWHPQGMLQAGEVGSWKTQSSTRQSTRPCTYISADWVMNGLTAALWRRAWGTPVVKKLEMSCQCVPTIQRANCTLAASRLSVTSRLREVILVLLLWDPSWRSVSSFWPTSARKTCTCLSESRERPKNYQCAATPLLWTKAERAGVCLAWGRDLTASILSLKWAYKRDGARNYHIL